MAVSEEASVVALVQQELTNTPYACSSLARMSAGTTNYVFRGTLFEPLTAHNGLRCKTIIIKHAKDHVPENESFPLDLSRCVSFCTKSHHKLNHADESLVTYIGLSRSWKNPCLLRSTHSQIPLRE